ncbi:GTPase IMAP family member 2-like [Pangasianodon hypophthalmus]|uniref:GTPase IMAP family member 2-like n=1 Tax=Pangasianodon hypophthalmus TaxID=310915 RepID=UPI00230797A4|nr:GTPase IMAP family member 2-like [Pangasianodon hypophthalmus]
MAQSSSGAQTVDVYSHKSPSDEPKSDLRLVLLGGDCAYNNYAADIILRSDNRKETSNPKKGNIREGTVDGRQVSVYVAPSYWMNHLASYWIFSNGVESIRDEIQNCTLVTFPGPHAFLLVMRAGHTTWKEHHLLKAITYMFGAEALQYTMVLFVYGEEWENPRDALKNRCVKMCGTRFYFLENSDESVKEFFRRIDAVTQKKKKSRFFIQNFYENIMKMYFEPWERAQENNRKRELEELKTEQRLREDVLKTKLDTLRQTESDLRKELEVSRHHKSVLQKDLDTARQSEKQLRMKLDELQGSEAEHLKGVRRNSKDFEQPVMPENKNKPLDDL